MIDRIGPRRRGAAPCHLAFCCALLIGGTGARWITPPPEPQGPEAAPAPSHPPYAGAAVRQPGGTARPSLAVTQWSLRSGNGEDVSATGYAPAGQPLTLRITLAGNAAAVAAMRGRGSIAIEIHWTRESAGAAAGAPNLITRLSIGHPGLADRLAAEVRRTGFFAWHSWAQKNSLSPGVWDVSLTYPNGRLLSCGTPPAPCRFRIRVG
jgi:hypothetical protein